MAKANAYTEQQVAFLSESYAELVETTPKGENWNANLKSVAEAFNAEFETTKSVVAVRSKLSTMGEYKTFEQGATATKSGATQKATLVKSLGAVTGLGVDSAVKMTKSELQGLLDWAESKAKATDEESEDEGE